MKLNILVTGITMGECLADNLQPRKACYQAYIQQFFRLYFGQAAIVRPTATNHANLPLADFDLITA